MARMADELAQGSKVRPLSIPNYRIFKRDSPNLRESPPLSPCNSSHGFAPRPRYIRELASISLRYRIVVNGGINVDIDSIEKKISLL